MKAPFTGLRKRAEGNVQPFFALIAGLLLIPAAGAVTSQSFKVSATIVPGCAVAGPGAVKRRATVRPSSGCAAHANHPDKTARRRADRATLPMRDVAHGAGGRSAAGAAA